ncbi:uncharacterized protein LOC115332334 [Ixodes scapularis]|uniref:uncharacterized protein LOC115332334 n=1 Tax=Ixodes scapularis TaxID=6945 RepID=UPI001A9DDCC5|nr:uncharacterized protein LOC115332334 [Ixodes scapularis]
MAGLYEFSLDRSRRRYQERENESSHKFTRGLETKLELGTAERSKSQSRIATKYRDMFGSFWDMPSTIPPLSPETCCASLSPSRPSPGVPPQGPVPSPRTTSPEAAPKRPPGEASHGHRPRTSGRHLRFSPSEPSPFSPPSPAASKRGIGQRLASFFRATKAKRTPRNQRFFTRGHMPTWKLASPMLGRRSRCRFASLRDRVPALIRKSLRRRSYGYAVNPLPRV